MLNHPAVYAAQCCAILAGGALARRRREHWPIVGLLTFGLVLDLGLEACGPSPSGPLFLLALLLGTAYPLAVLATVRWALLGTLPSALFLSALPLFLLFVLISGARGLPLAIVYTLGQAAISVALARTARVWRHYIGGRSASPTESCAIICGAAEIAQIPGYLALPYWTVARAVYAFAFLALSVVQARALLGGSSCSRASGHSSSPI